MNLSINKVLQFLNVTETEINRLADQWRTYKTKKDNLGNRLLQDTTMTEEELEQKMEWIAEEQMELFKLWYGTNKELMDSDSPHFTRAYAISRSVVNFKSFAELNEELGFNL